MNPQNYAHNSYCVVLCCGLVSVDFTNIIQGYFSGTLQLYCQWNHPVEYE